MPSTTSFDLFGDFSQDEQRDLDERRNHLNKQVEEKIASLSSDPQQRTMAENRLVFSRARSGEMDRPGLHCQLLSQSECQHVLDTCRRETEWTTDRHSAFATTDIPIRNHDQLAFLETLIKDRLFDELAHHYGFKTADLEFRDVFLVKYSANGQKGLRLHTDGCLFSLTLLISHEHDFQGGGTYYGSIDKVVHLKQGDAAYHAARVMHSGIDITQGVRYILVGFVDTVDTIAKDKRANKQVLRN
ncbi:hypothetical protein MAM1_0084d04646 [Mucor ambiguus]|uniref:Fe2OG dioxygenase domain-containing protein n=1 Tax=Mucor ambiguus TaxID=91626 RepID=A0A0C9MPJ2_9FUNG|nr:hypothetical protein MAM1_0084d04646 [Mucor ambiguus]